MRNSKTLEFMNNLNEKINKDNIEINKAIANPNLGKNKDRIKQAGYDIEYGGDYIKNPKTGKGIWPKDYNKDEKKKVDFKGKLDSERPTMSKTNRYKWDQEKNRIPKSAKVGFRNGGPVFNRDEAEFYSPTYNDESKKSVSTNINTYKKAVKDRDEKTKNATYYDKETKRDEDKIKEIEKDKERHQKYADSARKEADFAEQKRKELMNKVREKKTSTVKEGAEPIAKGLKKKLNESKQVQEKQTLNEETVGEKITSPSGKFWVGDPCYVLSDDIYYGVWDDKYNFEDGKIDVDDKLSFLVHGTAYGDGSYPSSNGFDYGVDSGTLAIIPMDLIAKTDGVQFGTVETSNTAWLDYNDGTFDITLDGKSFSIITSEDEEPDDEDWTEFEEETEDDE